MLGAKFLLIPIVGGFGSIVGCTSISTQEWDPEYVWRVGSKKEFYLTTCKREQREEDQSTKWNRSVISIYLTLEKGVSQVENEATLKLIGKGYYQKFEGLNPLSEKHYIGREDLHREINNGARDSWFELSTGSVSKKNLLGENARGEDSERWGNLIKCDKLFEISKLKEEQFDSGVGLSKIKFSLDCSGEKNYKGVKACEIKITNSSRNEAELKWDKGFKQPIVIF